VPQASKSSSRVPGADWPAAIAFICAIARTRLDHDDQPIELGANRLQYGLTARVRSRPMLQSVRLSDPTTLFTRYLSA
jgi:hypothetical protein